MHLRWTAPAANDLYAIVEHIQQDNPDAASEVGAGYLRWLRRPETFFPIAGGRGGSTAPGNSSSPDYPTLSSIGFGMS
jgi:hypothetical protein